ncbi:MAG: type I restriction-modification system subunit M [Bacteroidales bacterium]|nr:type I restriction-modification system subunit M [Bacteroidales bacterium]
METSHSQIVSLIWNIADDVLRDVFLRGQYRDVILPMVVLRRLDALLESTKEAVEKELKEQEEMGLEIIDEDALKDITGLSYFNTSKWTLNRLKSQASDNNDILYDNFIEYLNGFSENVRDVLKNFEYYNKARKLADNDRLLAIIEKITDPRINLTDKEAKDPDGIILPAMTNIGMGTVFEELLRRFNEENNEEAGEHFTPRDAISLLAHLVFEPVKDNLPKIISLYDPACGSGGMLTEGREYLLDIGVKSSAIQLSGTEINPETYAICKSDLIIKGVDPSGMHLGNTITDNGFSDLSFGYMITNPPYGKSWKTDKEKIYHEKTLLDHRFELPLTNFAGEVEVLDSTPRTSDGQLLFLLEEVDKMKPLEYQPQGSRVASIHNGSSLFTGDAGSGESNIRRYMIENDLVDAIIQLPNNIFYNTGITTYVWLLTNKKAANRKGKVQLIDASQAFEKLRKNQGSRNCTITAAHRDAILKTYMDFVEKEGDDNKVASKIFDGDDFRFYNVTIERPLRLRSQFNALKIDEMLYDKGELELSKWLYQTYGEKVFEGLNAELPSIKEYLNDNEIKMTDKKLAKLVSAKDWKDRRDLMNTAKQLMHAIGTKVYMDFNTFSEKVAATAKALELDAKTTTLNAIARAMSMTDPEAQPVIKKKHKVGSKDVESLMDTYGIDEKRLADYGFFPGEKGSYVCQYVEYEPDSDLRDTEKIPVKEDIYDYFQREVRPYVADAWINLPPIKIGCEISFNKYFYKPAPLRTLEENEHDILELDRQSQGFIQSLFK